MPAKSWKVLINKTLPRLGKDMTKIWQHQPFRGIFLYFSAIWPRLTEMRTWRHPNDWSYSVRHIPASLPESPCSQVIDRLEIVCTLCTSVLCPILNESGTSALLEVRFSWNICDSKKSLYLCVDMLCQILLKELGTSALTEVLFSWNICDSKKSMYLCVDMLRLLYWKK